MPDVGTHIRHFRFVGILGRGGMGEVYEGFDETLHRRVALKTIRTERRLDAAARARFLREARILSQLDHANICRIYDYVEGDDSDLLVLELIDGRTLRDAAPDLTFSQKLDAAISVARALAAAHRLGIIHRDLKPENVMLTPAGDIKVLDFGLARSSSVVQTSLRAPVGRDLDVTDNDETAVHTPVSSSQALPDTGTLLGDTVGTPRYMSPEQARGEEVTTASDMYSFGLVLQTVFGGHPPYPDDLPGAAVLDRAREGRSLPPRDIDRDVTNLITALKRVAPSDRPTAVDALAHLEAVATRSRRRARRIAAALALLIVGAGTVKYVVDVRAERAVAARRRAQAEELIGFMVGDLRKKLEPIGRVDVLSDVGNSALRYFSEVRPEEMTAAEMRKNARTLSQIGEVRIAEGNLAAADAAMRRSLALASAAVAREPRNADAQFELGTSEFWVGEVARLRSDAPEALRHYTNYLHVSEALARQHPANRDYAIETSYGHSNIGTLLEQRGDVASALKHYQEAVAIKERHLQQGPRARADLAKTMSKVGVALQALGRYDEARATFGREHDLLAEALRSNPLNATWLSWMATNRNRLAAVEDDTGHAAAALALLAEQQAIAARVASKDTKNAGSQRDLAMAWAYSARIQRAAGNFADAEKNDLAALAVMKPLLAKDPTRVLWKNDVVLMRANLAMVRLAFGDTAAARSEITAAEQILRTIGRGNSDTERVGWHLALAAGNVAASSGDAATAKREWASVADPLWARRGSLDNARLSYLARALIQLGRVSDAAPIVERLRRSGYRNAELLNLWTSNAEDARKKGEPNV